MRRATGPLFKHFGSKWLSSKTLPVPEHDELLDVFAGGAGYALRHAHKRINIAENDPNLFALWSFLISEATEATIREIPLCIKEGTDIRTLGLSNGQALLLKHWQRTNNVGNCWTISPWGNKPGQWTANTRARVSEEVSLVKHWTLHRDGFELLKRGGEATWFVDPIYQYNYRYRQDSPNYIELGKLCQSLCGQVIVCEAACQKTGKIPDWLPFKFFGNRITSRRKAGDNTHSRELLFTKSLRSS